MYEQIITQAEGQLFAIFSPHLLKQNLPKYLDPFPARLKNKQVHLKELITDSTDGQSYAKTNQSKLHHIKILPAKTKFPADTILSNNEVFLVAYGEGQVSGTQISSPEIYQSQMVLFEALWAQTK